MTLFIDIENKKLVQSLTSDRSVPAPVFMQGDNEPLEIFLLQKGEESLYEVKPLVVGTDFLRVAIARFKGYPKITHICGRLHLESERRCGSGVAAEHHGNRKRRSGERIYHRILGDGIFQYRRQNRYDFANRLPRKERPHRKRARRRTSGAVLRQSLYRHCFREEIRQSFRLGKQSGFAHKPRRIFKVRNRC